MGNDITSDRLVEEALRTLTLASPDASRLSRDTRNVRGSIAAPGMAGDASRQDGGGRAGATTTAQGAARTLTGTVTLAAKVANVTAAASYNVMAVEAISQLLFGYSIVEEWLRKPFAGDWDAVTTGARSWRAISRDVDTLGTDLKTVSTNTGELWRGSTFDAYVTVQAAHMSAYTPVGQASMDIADALDATTDLARIILDIVDNAIALAVDTCMRLAAEQTIPGIRQATSAVEIEALLTEVVQIAMSVNEALNSFLPCAPLLDGAAATMRAAHQDIKALHR
jgi:uncharacterized protein YukE